MADYYQAIDEEIRRKIARAGAKEEVRKNEIQRLDATARAYQARAAELLERYRRIYDRASAIASDDVAALGRHVRPDAGPKI